MTLGALGRRQRRAQLLGSEVKVTAGEGDQPQPGDGTASRPSSAAVAESTPERARACRTLPSSVSSRAIQATRLGLRDRRGRYEGDAVGAPTRHPAGGRHGQPGLPTPPGPVSVTSRTAGSVSSPATAATSASRPSSSVGGTGNGRSTTARGGSAPAVGAGAGAVDPAAVDLARYGIEVVRSAGG